MADSGEDQTSAPVKSDREEQEHSFGRTDSHRAWKVLTDEVSGAAMRDHDALGVTRSPAGEDGSDEILNTHLSPDGGQLLHFSRQHVVATIQEVGHDT